MIYHELIKSNINSSKRINMQKVADFFSYEIIEINEKDNSCIVIKKLYNKQSQSEIGNADPTLFEQSINEMYFSSYDLNMDNPDDVSFQNIIDATLILVEFLTVKLKQQFPNKKIVITSTVQKDFMCSNTKFFIDRNGKNIIPAKTDEEKNDEKNEEIYDNAFYIQKVI